MSVHGAFSGDAPPRNVERGPALGQSSKCDGRSRRYLIGVVLMAMVLRLTVFLAGPAFDSQRAFTGDSNRYVELAENLLSCGAFGQFHGEARGTIWSPIYELQVERGEAPQLDSQAFQPEVMRTPGYPAFIAVFRLFHSPIAGVILAQCLLSCATVVLVYLTAMELFGATRLALIAAATMAIQPGDIVSPNVVMSETLYVLLLFGALLAIVRGLRRNGSIRWMVGGGIILGLSTLVRPVGMVLGILLGIWVISRGRSRRSLLLAFAIAVMSFIPPGAWMARNALEGQGFRLSSFPTVHLAKTVAFMRMYDDGAKEYPKDFWPRYYDFFREVRLNIHEGEKTEAAVVRIARSRILTEPGCYAVVLTDGAVKFMTDHSVGYLFHLFGAEYEQSGLRDQFLRGNVSFKHFRPIVLIPAVWVLWNATMAFLMLLGFVVLCIRRDWAVVLVLAGLILYFIFASQGQGLERMRVPVMGLQSIAIAAFLARRQLNSIPRTSSRQMDNHGT